MQEKPTASCILYTCHTHSLFYSRKVSEAKSTTRNRLINIETKLSFGR